MQRFIPAEVLKQSYEVFGHFYSVEIAPREVVECRSVLEIASKTLAPYDPAKLSHLSPDAVFIMMNPGSSQPLVEVNNRIRPGAIHRLAISLVPTKPDTTQYQVMRLMRAFKWGHVRVLNLSDLRSSKSANFFKLYQRLERDHGFHAHSIFSQARTRELSHKLPTESTGKRAGKNTGKSNAPLVLAWGLSDYLNPLIDRCLLRLSSMSAPDRRIGLLNEGTTNKYRHPLPSLQKAKVDWLNQMLRQFGK
jgi:hypothetical protein